MTSVALDIGYQAIVDDHLVLGVGGGVAYQHAAPKPDYSSEHLEIIFLTTGFLPRFSFSLGYAF